MHNQAAMAVKQTAVSTTAPLLWNATKNAASFSCFKTQKTNAIYWV